MLDLTQTYPNRSAATKAAKKAHDAGEIDLSEVQFVPAPTGKGFVIQVAGGDDVPAVDVAADDAAPTLASLVGLPDDAHPQDVADAIVADMAATDPAGTATAFPVTAPAPTTDPVADIAALCAQAKADLATPEPYGPPVPAGADDAPAAADDQPTDDAPAQEEDEEDAFTFTLPVTAAAAATLAALLARTAKVPVAYGAKGGAVVTIEPPKARGGTTPAAPRAAPPKKAGPTGQTKEIIDLATRPNGALRSELDALPKNTAGYYNWRGRLRGIAKTWGYSLSESPEGAKDVRFKMVALDLDLDATAAAAAAAPTAAAA